MSKELEAAAKQRWFVFLYFTLFLNELFCFFRFNGTRHVGQAYGLTETTLSVTINPFGNSKPGSVGVVVPGMKAKVKNKEIK